MDKEKISLIWKKPLFTNHGLDKIDLNFCKNLLTQQEFDLHICSSNAQQQEISPSVKKNETIVTVMHQWPPNWNAPDSNLILMHSREADSNPPHWFNIMKEAVNEIWVHSQYFKEMYVKMGIPEDQINVIPLGVDEAIYHYGVEPLDMQDNASFRFLFVDGTMKREAVDIILQAYYLEFTADEDVCLTIKMTNTDQQVENPFTNTPPLDTNYPRVFYINKPFSEPELASLYKACNCVIHLYPGDGYGTQIIEAMACGTPAIVPNIGPSIDYCDNNSSFLLPLKNEEETSGKPLLARVDQKELQKLMRFVYENRLEVKKKGKKASEKILSTYTWKQTTNILTNTVKQLVQKNSVPPLEDRIMSGMQLYKTNRLEDAIKLFLNILTEYPDSIATHYNIAIVYLQTKQYKEAINHLLNITNLMDSKSNDFQANIWYYLGVCYSLNRIFPAAIDAFQRATALIPSLRTQEIFFLNKFIQRNNELTYDLYYELGNCYFNLGNDFKAEEMYMKALESGGEQTVIIEALMQVYKRIHYMKKQIMLPLNHHKTSERLCHHSITWLQSVSYPPEDSEKILAQRRKRWEPYFVNGNHVLEIQWRNKTKINISQAEPIVDGILLLIRENSFSTFNMLNALKYSLKRINHSGKIIIIMESRNNIPVPFSATNMIRTALIAAGWSIKDTNLLETEDSFYIVSQKTNYDVLWQSVLFNSSGYAEEQNHFLDAIRPYPIRIKASSVDQVPPLDQYPPEIKTYLLSLQQQQITSPLIHYQAAPADAFTFPISPISIGRTMFETDSLPPSWVEILNEMTEIWVPSEFNRETFSSAGVKLEKIKILPEPLDENKYNPYHTLPFPLKGIPSFKFLSVFDWSARKGWEILLQAYFEEFRVEDDVSLILKVSKINEPNTNPYRKINQLAKNLGIKKLPHVHIIQEYLTQEDIISLYVAVDCFVLPSRGEGWGRPYMEAMAMELPTIGTRWSGQQAFMKDDNSYLINIDGLIPVDPIGMPPHFHGHKWAQPSVDHLKVLMRYVYEHPEEAKKKGVKARKDLFPQFSRHTIGKQIYERMDELVNKFYR